MLRRVANPDKAASIVGDLLEADKGPLWFWIAVAGTVLRLAWRRPMAVLVAWLAMEIGTRVFITVALHNHYPSQNHQTPFGALYLRRLWSDLIGMCAFAMICSSGTRRMVLPTALFAVFPAIAVCYWLQPTVLLADALCVAAAIGVLVWARSWKLPFAIFLGALAMIACQEVVGILTGAMYQIASRTQGVSQSAAYMLGWFWLSAGSGLILVYVATSIWSRLFRWADSVAQ